jgi:hypothetical protein
METKDAIAQLRDLREFLAAKHAPTVYLAESLDAIQAVLAIVEPLEELLAAGEIVTVSVLGEMPLVTIVSQQEASYTGRSLAEALAAANEARKASES